MIKERLEKENYTVDVAYDGEKGLYMAQADISFLRKKISFLKSNVKIKTIRGAGYCLEADGGER